MKLKEYIDLQRFAGVSTILGIELGATKIRALELKAKGLWKTYEVKSFFELSFDQATTIAQRGELLKAALSEKNIRTKHASLNIPQSAVRTAAARIPQSTQSIDDWIDEHLEGLLKVPAQASEITYRYESLREDGETKELEVNFIRKQDLLKALELAESAGLELVGIAPGIRDLARLTEKTAQTDVIHIEEKTFTCGMIRDGRCTDISTRPIGELEAYITQRAQAESSKLLISGEYKDQQTTSIRNLPSDYLLSYALALRGFDQKREMDFLPQKLKEAFDVRLNKNLTQRLVIASGIILIVLLLIPMLLEFYLESQLEDAGQLASDSRTKQVELLALERQVENLKSQLDGGSRTARSNTAEILQDIAKSTPEDLWLYELRLWEKKDQSLKLTGYARSNEMVTVYLKNLEKMSTLKAASLIRQGSPEPGEPVERVSQRLPSIVTFEIKAEVR